MNKLYRGRRAIGAIIRARNFTELLLVLLMSIVGTQVFAQSRTIIGVVTDGQKQTIPGVTIQVKGSKIITQTDEEGRYRIQALPADQLVFNYVGYQAETVSVGAKTTINITLKPSSIGLSDVVVIGYGSANRNDLSTSIASVKMSDFEKAPVKSFEEALAGRVAGVQVAGSDGQPGAVSNIVIRGAGSITQDNSPLYVIDGFPMDNANNNSINPDDIESIDVLKDAAATAIYGSRGANGVIQIVTKRGKTGKPVVAYNGYYGLQENTKRIAVMDPYNFVKLANELDPVGTAQGYFIEGRTLESYQGLQGTDYQDQLFKIAPYQNHSLSLRGGADQTKYSLSTNYQDQEGIIINSGFSRIQSRFTLDHNVSKKVKAGINVNYSYTQSYGGPIGSSNFSASINTLYSIWGYRPITGSLLPIDDQLYDPGLPAVNVYSDYRANPILDLKNRINNNKSNNLDANAYVEYEIIKGLKLKSTGGISIANARVNAFYGSNTALGGPYTAQKVNGSIYNNTGSTWLNENTLTYAKKINNAHNLNAVIGFSNQFAKTGSAGFSATNVPNESLGLDALDLSTSIVARSVNSTWGMQSFFTRVSYDYKSTYLFTASYRADGSSRFAPGEKWGYFPAVSAAWKIKNESFLKDAKILSDAKIRTSYGETGNNRVSDFAYLSQLAFPLNQSYSFNNNPPELSAMIGTFGNEGLKWETSRQTNIGIDLGFLKQRMLLTADIYRKKTSDLLLNAQLPYTTGASNAFKNVGAMQNDGLELTLNTVNIQNKNFRWTTNFNISFNKNKVVSLAENQQYLATTVGFDTRYSNIPPYISVLGQSVGQLYGHIFDGIYQYSDFDKMPNGAYALKSNIPTNSNARANIKPGDIKFKDINGDGVVNEQDRTIIGRGLPLHVGGFSNNFTYKNFDLNVFFQWSYGNNLINANRLMFEGSTSNNPFLNQFATYIDRWSPTNPSNTYYRAGGGINTYSSNVVEDGSYLRLKTVSLGYNFSKKLLDKIKLSSLRVYASAQNLFTMTNYSGPDPEVSTRNSVLTPGFDFSAYPRPRTIVFGLNTSF